MTSIRYVLPSVFSNSETVQGGDNPALQLYKIEQKWGLVSFLLPQA